MTFNWGKDHFESPGIRIPIQQAVQWKVISCFFLAQLFVVKGRGVPSRELANVSHLQKAGKSTHLLKGGPLPVIIRVIG